MILSNIFVAEGKLWIQQPQSLLPLEECIVLWIPSQKRKVIFRTLPLVNALWRTGTIFILCIDNRSKLILIWSPIHQRNQALSKHQEKSYFPIQQTKLLSFNKFIKKLHILSSERKIDPKLSVE